MEVGQMDMVQATHEHGMWVIACRRCGPLGVADDETVDDALIAHMVAEHGAMVPA